LPLRACAFPLMLRLDNFRQLLTSSFAIQVIHGLAVCVWKNAADGDGGALESEMEDVGTDTSEKENEAQDVSILAKIEQIIHLLVLMSSSDGNTVALTKSCTSVSTLSWKHWSG
jgi:hypothetical protein